MTPHTVKILKAYLMKKIYKIYKHTIHKNRNFYFLITYSRTKKDASAFF